MHPLPLRPPAMLAQAAASLDILSHGRFELALGTGGYRDAIASMGAPRLTPGQAVDALEEGIAIIRAAWDTDAPGGIRHLGERYRVEGAPRGPRPAHDMGIWLGAYQPRMLRMTGRLADGWLPSLSRYRSFAELGAGNAVIDEAAAEAGRSPAGIRRLLNLDREREPWQLAELALEHGVSGFILMARDVRAIERFAAETAPAVRELVAAGRSPPPPDLLPHLNATPHHSNATPHRWNAAPHHPSATPRSKLRPPPNALPPQPEGHRCPQNRERRRRPRGREGRRWPPCRRRTTGCGSAPSGSGTNPPAPPGRPPTRIAATPPGSRPPDGT
ncbi:LLM class flavin-dependent oxidoreductase [Nonomuraea sp. NPDC048892]|uniref:LLM class flavin-dependent oxidoreductase n=1 Tax=Nonomuraea sp. NPDC048892 TaxID=3154624 RepID=UPI0033E4AC73